MPNSLGTLVMNIICRGNGHCLFTSGGWWTRGTDAIGIAYSRFAVSELQMKLCWILLQFFGSARCIEGRRYFARCFPFCSSALRQGRGLPILILERPWPSAPLLVQIRALRVNAASLWLN